MARTDIQFKINDIIFNCRAVAIIIYDDKILFQKENKMSFGLYLEEK